MLDGKSHDELQNFLVATYPAWPGVECRWCASAINLPVANRLITEFRHQLGNTVIRSDIAALDTYSSPVAFMEVVDTNEPRTSVIEAYEDSEVPVVFVSIGRFSVTKGQAEFYCSAFCWKYRREPRISTLETCACCDSIDFRDGSFHDWSSDPHYAYCFRCAASHGGQWSGPAGESDMFEPQDSPDMRFRQWELARFWRMVWLKRAEDADSSSPQYDESRTTRQLDKLHRAFDAGDWRRGAELLMPIGSRWAPGDRGQEDRPLYAWDPGNCRRTADGWDRLYALLFDRLPPGIQDIIRHREGRTSEETDCCVGCGREFSDRTH